MARSTVAAALKSLRKRAGLSVRETAAAIGRPPSSYSRYEDAYKRSYLPPDLVQSLIPVFERHGVGRAELLPLAGLTDPVVPRPLAEPPPRRWLRESLDYAGEAYSAVPVYDIRAAAGAGALNEDEAPEAWALHRTQWLQRLTRAPLDRLAMLTVAGDSMWETLHDGDQVLVDRAIRSDNPRYPTDIIRRLVDIQATLDANQMIFIQLVGSLVGAAADPAAVVASLRRELLGRLALLPTGTPGHAAYAAKVRATLEAFLDRVETALARRGAPGSPPKPH